MMKKAFLKFLANRIDIVAVTTLTLFLCLLNITYIGSGINQGILLSNSLDFSWQIDSIERLLHGYIAGRDFIFTYGPFYQVLASIPSILFGMPSYLSVLYANVGFIIIVSILLFILTASVTKNTKDRTVLYCLSVLLLFHYPSSSDLIRILLPFIYAFLYVRYIIPAEKISLKYILVLLLPGLFGLYTFDLFLFCVITTVVFAIITFMQKKNIFSFAPIIFIVLVEFVISLLLTNNLNYLLYSLDTVKNYQYVMNIPWTIDTYTFLLFIPLLLLILFVYTFITKKEFKKNYILIAFVLTALLNIKSAVIRYDSGHILMAIYPSILILFFFFFLVYKVNKVLLLSIAISIAVISSNAMFLQRITLDNFGKGINAPLQAYNFFDIYKLPPNTYNQNDIEHLSKYIIEQSNNVLVYPYDSYILNIYGKTYNTLPLQFYQYSNSIVEKNAVDKLQQNPPLYIILGVDDQSVVKLDSIPHFTRNPLIAKWMLQNYSPVEIRNSYILLSYDQNKSKISYAAKDCNVFEIPSNKLFETTTLEDVGKTSTIFLDTKEKVRLPYSPNNTSYLVIEGSNDANTLGNIFKRPYTFKTNRPGEKDNFTLIKQYPIPFFKDTITKKLDVYCY